MEPSIQIKGDTIEDAVKTALSLLDATMDQVTVTVLSSPSKSLFGLRKRPAEVVVVKKAAAVPVTDKRQEFDLEQMIDSLKGDDEHPYDLHVEHGFQGGDEPVLIEKEGSWVQIQNGRVFVKAEGQRYPIIEPADNVRVVVNGRQIQERTAVTSLDDIAVHITDEVVASMMNVQLIEQDMLAVLSYVPGKRVKRYLKDIEPAASLRIEAEEEVIESNDLEEKKVLARLQELQVVHGVLKHVIKDVCQNPGSTDYIIAKGTYPKEGLNGDVHVLVQEPDDMTWNEAEKVDYREKNMFMHVEEGEIIAEVIPSVPGVAGENLLGNPVLPKPVKDVTVRTGKNVILTNQKIIALKGGRPQLEWRGMLLKADVMEELVHAKDVDLESGNIHFYGDVRVQGSVQESMTIESGGKVFIKGTVSKAKIEAGQSVTVENNVFSSQISAGNSNIIIDELVVKVKEILYYLDHMMLAIKQLMMVRHENENALQMGQLHYLIRLLLERKYTDFSGILSRFITKVNDNSKMLEKEWIDCAERLRSTFISLSKEQVNEVAALEDLTEELRELYELYRIPAAPGCRLTVPYAINSSLYSSGDLVVSGQGIYHCQVRTGNDVLIRGVCRGGEITAGRNVTIDEVGSEAGSKTRIQVPEDGVIKMNTVFEDTTIQIGRRVHTFAVAAYNINARLNSDGTISLY
ncbi:hypothetical protein BTO30_03520 [Domibacillus antri]|uniref:RNA-binding protein KhpB N-terminal domain-containing protein n=1 Tax=Domibacillus antri TaxID=1714264 RepID=A0A1Q8Q8J6_9BACI|nr:FapA family protein [Domibacillus antri]OLN23650.1 hypothetical protein BTO30_03520 [Domibacillus antri]